MSIFTDRDLERLASLKMNWRKEFLNEVVRLRQEREPGGTCGQQPSTQADARPAGDSPRRPAGEAC